MLPCILNAQALLEIQNLEITKKNPAIFVLDLVEDDIVEIEYNRLDGDITKLSYDVINVHYQDYIAQSVKRGSSDFKADETGRFKIEFKSTSNVTISLGIYKSPALDIPPGGSAQLIEVRGIRIPNEKDVSKQLRITYILGEGDQISFMSGDSKAQIIKAELVEAAEYKDLSSQPTFSVTRDARYNIRFYPSPPEKTGFNKILDKLRKKNFQLENLSINVTKAPDESLYSSSGSGSQLDSEEGNSGDQSQNADGGIDYGAILAQNQESSNNTMEIMRQQLAEGKASNDDMLQLMANIEVRNEMLRKEQEERRIRPRYYIRNESLKPVVYDSLFPSRDYSMIESTNKKCYELNFHREDEFLNQIYYYVYAADKDTIDAIIDKQDYERGRNGNRLLWDQIAINIFNAVVPKDGSFSMDPNNNPRRNVSPPLIQEHPEIFVEDIEFAILDQNNRDRFMKNEGYFSPYGVQKTNVQVELGVMDFIDTKEYLKYACFKNNNKSTKVRFGFRAFAIRKENRNTDF